MQQKHDHGRFSAKRKTEAVLRLLRGDELDALSLELGVTAATLSVWRDEFLAAGEASLKSRQTDSKEDEIRVLKGMAADIAMRNKLLRERCHQLEAGLPLARRRSRS